MITAIDTNILLDILIPDEIHSLQSKERLDRHAEKGRLIICELVYAELAAQFISARELKDFLADTGIRLIPSDESTLHAAGERWMMYARSRRRSMQCANCGARADFLCPKCRQPIACRQRILSDFIIGAHAMVHAEALLTRDRGFYRAYFRDLKIGM